MGHGVWGMGLGEQLPPMPHAPCPMPHAPCPMPHAPVAPGSEFAADGLGGAVRYEEPSRFVLYPADQDPPARHWIANNRDAFPAEPGTGLRVNNAVLHTDETSSFRTVLQEFHG